MSGDPTDDDHAGGGPDAQLTSLRVRLEVTDPLSRAGLAALLAMEGIEVIEEFTTGAPADVALWDADGDEAPPETTEPLLAVTADVGRSAELVTAGASGVLPRRSGASTLAAAVTALTRGLGVLPAARLQQLLAPMFESAAELPLDALTVREREVLELVADGLTNRAIAERLDIGLSTVKFHLTSLLSKFAANTRTELVMRAVRSGEILV